MESVNNGSKRNSMREGRGEGVTKRQGGFGFRAPSGLRAVGRGGPQDARGTRFRAQRVRAQGAQGMSLINYCN